MELLGELYLSSGKCNMYLHENFTFIRRTVCPLRAFLAQSRRLLRINGGAMAPPQHSRLRKSDMSTVVANFIAMHKLYNVLNMHSIDIRHYHNIQITY